MWILASAVATASLLGSLHCVGMCGPLAIWASGAGEGRRGLAVVSTSGLYHAGRLASYAAVGLLAGAVGQLTDLGGQALGVQLLAARIVGSFMILFGVLRLWQLLGPVRTKAASNSPKPSGITQLLIRLRPAVFRLPIPARALATGLLTAFLPCGWLYLFALVAAGTGSWLSGPVVMTAFWLGSVPALVALVSGTQILATRFRKLVPAAAAGFLILGGCYTAAGRGFASLSSLSDIAVVGKLNSAQMDNDTSGTCAHCASEAAASTEQRLAEELSTLITTPLPCCAEHAEVAP